LQRNVVVSQYHDAAAYYCPWVTSSLSRSVLLPRGALLFVEASAQISILSDPDKVSACRIGFMQPARRSA
jgi:hypothetical protein